MAGTLLAILMARRGFRVDLFEQHPDPRSGDGCLQLCSNLALGERARHALRVTGLLRQVDALSTPMRGRLIHDRAGNVTEQPYGYRAYETLYSVRRESLQQCLLFEAALHPEIRVHFGHRLRSVDWAGKVAEFTHNGDATVHRQPFDVLIGADGAKSAVARQHVPGADRMPCVAAYHEIVASPPPGGSETILHGLLGEARAGAGLCAKLDTHRASSLPFSAPKMERHEHSEQLFVPLGEARYVIAAACPGADGNPDLATLRGFLVTGMLIPLILFTIAVVGFIEGLVLGLLAALIQFVLKYSRTRNLDGTWNLLVIKAMDDPGGADANSPTASAAGLSGSIVTAAARRSSVHGTMRVSSVAGSPSSASCSIRRH